MLTETALWSDLVACLLTSAVTERIAIEAHRRLAAHGLLDPITVSSRAKYEHTVADVLRSDSHHGPGYRFPNSRARHIAESWSAAYETPGRGLLPYLRRAVPEEALRVTLVNRFPGMGFKQASLFLTRTGHAVDLVALDTHILRYLRLRGHACDTVSPRSQKRYLELEGVFRRVTRKWLRPASVVDFAVWLTMAELSRMRQANA